MSELVAEVKTLLVYMKCDECGEGLMEPHGNIVLSVDPPLYPHKCNNCGHVENYRVGYPYTRFVPKEQLREPTKSEIVDNE